MPPCGGAPNLQGVEQEAEACLRLLRRHAEHREQPRLHLGVVDTDAAAAALVAVDDQVVRLGLDAAGIAFQLGQVLVHRGGERVMVGGPAFFLVVPDERREIADPGDLVIDGLFGSKSLSTCARCVRRVPKRLATMSSLSATNSSRSPALAVEPLAAVVLLNRGGQEFLDAAGEFLGFDLDPGAALAAGALDDLGQFIDLLARELVGRPAGVDAPAPCRRIAASPLETPGTRSGPRCRRRRRSPGRSAGRACRCRISAWRRRT